ncbi:Membrane-bound lytic murein transglycosylase B precursor [Rhodovulum sp. PH10]|uniref:lytic murein transglycosylase n=1 Tax=Rhodovulum sp. PH10 TaxID=1187851 RepID=UPI00027C23EA|nr:lytic murein transglycosylase [Rhodovulum sp. PH10]EJW10318.1 Membrane-bound lytic murein transglycosylase B precursor [Rhodovulum sp. PH10]
MPTRRRLFGLAGALAAGLIGLAAGATPLLARESFESWRAGFKAHAVRRGVSAETYDRVMDAIEPDTRVFALQRAQPEFQEALWQYLNRRVSDWRIVTGRQRAREEAALLGRLERDYGVDPYLLVALWGVESSFGEVIDNPKYMRPVIPALAALAWGEPRRRRYWEQELTNALRIVDRGWASPDEMIGSWAGAMGHTQWMPEVWLNVGVDYDHDGRISPFGRPDDALAGTARYLLKRGKYRAGEAWGCEVRLPGGLSRSHMNGRAWRTYAEWASLGVLRADGAPFRHPSHRVRLRRPVSGGPAFLTGRNFEAVHSYNPAFSYALAIAHLSDRIRGGDPFVQNFPGAEERTPTLAEIQEIQRRLTKLGFDTGGTDGRVGSTTMRAVGAYQRKVGMKPDGYAGLELLARLRRGS